MTKQRALILDIINKSYDHMTAEEVYKKAVKKMRKGVKMHKKTVIICFGLWILYWQVDLH